jgi:hypothetical protein
MKSLYIRFFHHKDNTMPLNSYAICGNTARVEIVSGCIGCEAGAIADWMVEHPEGKVDFVWA